jgi:peptidyl-prolyl cis-trans isomerase D
MMQLLRKKTKAIMIFVAASFLIGFIFMQLGVGTSKRTNRPLPNIGIINGVEISYNDFYETQNNIISQMRAQGREELTEEDYNRIEQQTWNELVYQILVQQEIDRRNIVVGDEEVDEFLENNPPEFIRGNENFQVDGQFNREQYLQILNAPENQAFRESLEDYIRKTLPQLKLSSQITLGIHFSDDALLRTYKERKEQVRVGYVFFDPTSLDDVNDSQQSPGEEELLPIGNDSYMPTDEEIRSYFQNHQNDYIDEEKAIIQYIELSASPTSRDTLDARNKAVALIERIGAGEDFGDLAKEFSADPVTADKGGELGFLGRGEMLSAIEEVAFTMTVGQISDPILTPRGWHIVKVDERRGREKKEEVSAMHILIPIKVGIATRDSVYGQVRDIFNDLREETGSFEEIASSYNIPLKITEPFAENDFIPELGPVSREASQFAFSQDQGAVSQSITRIGRIYILRVREKIPERLKTLDEVRGEIEELLSTENKMQSLEDMAKTLLAGANQSGSLEEAASVLELEYQMTPLFSRNDFVPNIGRGNAFIGYAHSLPKGKIGGPVKTDRGYYLVEVLEQKGIEMEAFEESKDDLRTELINRERSSAFEQWFSSLLDEAEIVDNRLFFGYSG